MPWQEGDTQMMQVSQYLLVELQWPRRTIVETKMERKQGPICSDEGFQFDSFESKGTRSRWKILSRDIT